MTCECRKRGRSRHRSRSRSRSRSLSRSGKRSRKAAWKKYRSKVSINPFFNYLAQLRRQFPCGTSAVEVSKHGGRCWRNMSCDEKKPFIRMACRAQRRNRRVNRKKNKYACS